jgi:hypothetical protein
MLASTVAGSAPAQTITVNGACFVNANPNVGSPVTISGSGFVPGHLIRLTAPAWLIGAVPAGLAGTFQTTVPGPRLGTAGPAVSRYTLTAQDQNGSGAIATTSFSVANLAFRTTPATASPSTRVRFTFSGFRPNAAIYGHYVLRGRVVATARFGRARGACGLLSARSRLFPGGHPRFGKYVLQFDDSRRYHTRTVPRIVSGLTVRRA